MPVQSSAPSTEPAFPPFVPHPLLRGGHRQTLAGRFLVGPKVTVPATPREIDAGYGDRLSVLDSIPTNWRPGDPAAVLVHGLGGCARSPYIERLAARLLAQGVRAVRMNLRGAGAGFGLARGTYHGGRTDDLRSIGRWLHQGTPKSPISWIGFSLGANLVLKYAAEASDHPFDGLDCVLAANPPLDLAACCESINRPNNRIYDRNFVRNLRGEVLRLHARFPELPPVDLSNVKCLRDFDACYTSLQNGFVDVADYYEKCSAGPLLSRIAVPGLVVHAQDDPFIPAKSFQAFRFPPNLALELIPSGGHLGYVSQRRIDGDHRWLDSRFQSWLVQHWNSSLKSPFSPSNEGTRTESENHGRHPLQ